MSDLISRSALMKDKVWLCGGYIGDEYAKGYMEALDNVEKVINSQPTVEAKPVVHGKWIMKVRNNGGYVASITCSTCGCSHHRATYNFCPECGADMRGEKNGL